MIITLTKGLQIFWKDQHVNRIKAISTCENYQLSRKLSSSSGYNNILSLFVRELLINMYKVG